MQRKKFEKPRLALLNIELELKSEKENAELRIENVEVGSGERWGRGWGGAKKRMERGGGEEGE